MLKKFESSSRAMRGQLLPSGSDEQQAFNQGIVAYLKELSNTYPESLPEALELYALASQAEGLINTQKTNPRNFPTEKERANTFLGDIMLHIPPRLVRDFPPECRGNFYRLYALRQPAEHVCHVSTPYGILRVAIARETGDCRWFPSIEGQKAPTYILAGTYSQKGSFEVRPIYEGKEFWGVECEWETRLHRFFAWEIKIPSREPYTFSLVRENDRPFAFACYHQQEQRQGDLLFSPYEGRRPVNAESAYRMVESCSMEPFPISMDSDSSEECVLTFVVGTAEVKISHMDHRTITVRPSADCRILVHRVNGHTHYIPRESSRD